jgi:hypothetical protein
MKGRPILSCFVVVLILTILAVTNYRCTHAVCSLYWNGNADQETDRMAHALLERWVETGSLPAFLTNLDEDDLPDRLRYWRYERKPGDFPNFTLSVGDYNRCGWEIWIGFEARWNVTSDPASQSEVIELLRLVTRQYLADGNWPVDLAAIVFPATWDPEATWNYICPRMVADRFGNGTLRGSLVRTGRDGVETVLEFDPPDLYVDT